MRGQKVLVKHVTISRVSPTMSLCRLHCMGEITNVMNILTYIYQIFGRPATINASELSIQTVLMLLVFFLLVLVLFCFVFLILKHHFHPSASASSAHFHDVVYYRMLDHDGKRSAKCQLFNLRKSAQ